MMNVLTNSTTMAKPSRTLPKMSMNSPKSAWDSPITVSPDTTSTSSGSRGSMAAISSSVEVPAAAATTIESIWFGASRTVCTVSRSNRLK